MMGRLHPSADARRHSLSEDIMTKLHLLPPRNSQRNFIDRPALTNNVVALAKSAKVFGIQTTITTVGMESFSGHAYPELLAVFPEAPILGADEMGVDYAYAMAHKAPERVSHGPTLAPVRAL
jgi:hypothetical protein